MSSRWKVPLADIDLGEEERQAVLRVLDSTWLTMGKATITFEQQFTAYLGAPDSVAVSSGTAALHIAARLAGLQSGDEVLVPSLTFVASANAMLYEGARPVFVDVKSSDDWTVDPDDIRAKVTPRTKAICVVHYGGYLCDMAAILDIAREHNLVVIEDAAHAPGARLEGQAAGTIGDIGCFSFFSNKNMTSAEGGMVVTTRHEWADRARRLRSHGMTTVTWQRHAGHASSYDVLELGYNYRMTDLHAAIGMVQLQKLEANNARRAALIHRYRTRLQDIPMVSVPFQVFRGQPAYHLSPVLLDDRIDRQSFMAAMRSEGIQTSVHYPPIHQFAWYRERFRIPSGTLPRTEQIGSHMVTLPLYPSLDEERVDAVVDAVERLARV